MFAVKFCKELGCKMKAWSGGVCINHTPKKAISSMPKPTNNNDRILKIQEFFLSIWKKKPHKSEISDTSLGSEALSVYFHHILAKEKYPEACFDEENIIFLTLLEHADVESDMYKFEEINRRRTLLLVKYGKI
jgi:hypothetical protein